LTELECPRCQARQWTLGSDHPGLGDGNVPWSERTFRCPACGYRGASFGVLQQSPPEVILEMTQPGSRSVRPPDLEYWYGVLETHFPGSPLLESRRRSTVRAGDWLATVLARWRRSPRTAPYPGITTSHCPLCSGDGALPPRRPEGPGAWPAVEVLCGAHAALAVTPDGRRLADVVGSSRQQVEGPGLAFLFNPVTVGEKRAWATWLGPAYRVEWPRWRCDDTLEFLAFHQPASLDALCLVDVHGEVLRSVQGVDALHVLATVAGPAGLATVQRLCEVAWRRDRYAAALQAVGKRCAGSMVEAYQLMSRVEIETPSPADIAARLPVLAELSRRRFAGRVQEWALDFESPLSMAEIRERLNAAGPWQWIWRDKDAFGPYLSAHPQGLRSRLYDLDGYHSNGPTYTVEVAVRAPCPLRKPEVDEIVGDLLARIEAREIQPGDLWD
jgi:hypothetical protein